jgi:hypothetical protein
MMNGMGGGFGGGFGGGNDIVSILKMLLAQQGGMGGMNAMSQNSPFKGPPPPSPGPGIGGTKDGDPNPNPGGGGGDVILGKPRVGNGDGGGGGGGGGLGGNTWLGGYTPPNPTQNPNAFYINSIGKWGSPALRNIMGNATWAPGGGGGGGGHPHGGGGGKPGPWLGGF